MVAVVVVDAEGVVRDDMMWTLTVLSLIKWCYSC